MDCKTNFQKYPNERTETIIVFGGSSFVGKACKKYASSNIIGTYKNFIQSYQVRCIDKVIHYCQNLQTKVTKLQSSYLVTHNRGPAGKIQIYRIPLM